MYVCMYVCICVCVCDDLLQVVVYDISSMVIEHEIVGKQVYIVSVCVICV